MYARHECVQDESLKSAAIRVQVRSSRLSLRVSKVFHGYMYASHRVFKLVWLYVCKLPSRLSLRVF